MQYNFFLLFKVIKSLTSLDKRIRAGKIDKYYEKVTDEDEAVTFVVSNKSSTLSLRYLITVPSDDEGNEKDKNKDKDLSDSMDSFDDSSFSVKDIKKSKKKIVDENVVGLKINPGQTMRKSFKIKGVYILQITNPEVGTSCNYFMSVHTSKKIIGGGSKEILQFKENSRKLSNAMEGLRFQNQHLNEFSKKSIEDANSISKMLNYLIVMPFIIILIGVFKHFAAIYLVKPKKIKLKKRFLN